MKQRTALFPGSFDPITLGHLDLVQRAAQLFDKIVIAVGSSDSKTYLFSSDERVALVKEVCAGISGVEVCAYTGLTTDVAKSQNACCILRGLRHPQDLAYEQQMEQMNAKLLPGLETLYLSTNPKLTYVSSSLTKEIARHKGDLSALVPPTVSKKLSEKIK